MRSTRTVRLSILLAVATGLFVNTVVSADSRQERSPSARDLSAMTVGANREPPLRMWQFSEFRSLAGEEVVEEGSKVVGEVDVAHTFGIAGSPFGGDAIGTVFSSRNGEHWAASSTTEQGLGGNKVKLTQYQAFTKFDPNARIQLEVTQALLLLKDLTPPGSCDAAACGDVAARIDVEVSVYDATEYYQRKSGTVFSHGSAGAWSEPAVWAEGYEGAPLWRDANFQDVSVNDEEQVVDIRAPLFIDLFLGQVAVGQTFTLRAVTTITVLHNHFPVAGSTASFADPLDFTSSQTRVRGVVTAADPLVTAPADSDVLPQNCPIGIDPAAGELRFSADAYTTDESASDSTVILVERVGGASGPAAALVVSTVGTATAGSDYESVGTVVTFGDGDDVPRLVRVPITEDEDAEGTETFTLEMTESDCAEIGVPNLAVVTISDDESAPSFAIGGTVSGLVGGDLVLRNLGEDVSPIDGQFAFAERLPAGFPYDVTVAVQPSDQICSVTNGAGIVADADVTDVAVDCVVRVPDSDLDASFGANGLVISPELGPLEAVAQQPDGMLVVARGSTLARYDTNGTLDDSFGIEGVVDTGLDAGFVGNASDVVVQPDGQIVVVGVVSNPTTDDDFAVRRYDSVGAPDFGFGQNGLVTTDFNGSLDQPRGVTLLAEGGIAVAGFTQLPGGGQDFAVARYTAAGAPDTTFGGDGTVTTDIGEQDFGNDLVAQPDDQLVVVGETGDDSAVVRYSAAGVPDPGFGSDGVALIGSDLGISLNSVAIDAEQRIVLAGSVQSGFVGGGSDFAVARLLTDGQLDGSFDGDGILATDFAETTGPASQDEFGFDVAVQADGKIVVVGTAQLAFPAGADLALVRYDGNGVLDPDFGSGGRRTVDFFGAFDTGHSVLVQDDDDGLIVAAGSALVGVDVQAALVRILP
jgi:uncharacterized delta-60 repeat protein